MRNGLETGRMGSFRGIELLAFGSENREAWLEWLLHCGIHDFFQRPEFHDLAQKQGEGTARVYLLRAGDSVLGLPCLLQRLPFPVGNWIWDAHSVRGYPGPFLAGRDRTFVGRALGVLEEWFREEGVLTVFSLLNPMLGQGNWLEGVGEVRWLGSTVAMDLSQDEDAVFRGIRPSHRRAIRRLEKAGLWCGTEDASTGLEGFVRAYSETMGRVGAQSVYLHGEDFFRELFATHGERIHLWQARIGDQEGPVVAGALLGEGVGIGEYYLSGTLNAWVEISPMKNLLEAVWRWGRRRGWRYLHLGGGAGSKDSLFEFKAGFSPLRFPMACWRWVLDGDAYDVCCREAETEWAARRLRVVQPDFFPRYRSPVDEMRREEAILHE